jgi:hypothetical protein
MISLSLYMESAINAAPAIDARAKQAQDAIAASAILADAKLEAEERRWDLEWSRRNIED